MNRHSVLGSVTGIVVFAALLAACGGAASGTASAGGSPQAAGSDTAAQGAAPGSGQGTAPPDPCTVITEQDATTTLGADPGPGKPKVVVAGFIRECDYGSGTELVNVTVSTATTRAKFDETRASEQQIFGSAFHDVGGAGDAAFLQDGFLSGHLTLYKGNLQVEILVSHNYPHAGDMAAGLTVLGKAAAGRV